MYDPCIFSNTLEPTPAAKHREEYYRFRHDSEPKAKSSNRQSTADVKLLHAQMIVRIGRYFRFA